MGKYCDRMGTKVDDTKLFFNFLVENKALFQFHNYIDMSLQEYCETTTIGNFIIDMDDWKETSQGIRFWEQLHQKWLKTIKYRLR